MSESTQSLAPRKSLGQHFLRDRGALHDIAARTFEPRAAVVFEVGPGPGALTTALAGDREVPHGARLVLVEKDRRFVAELEERYADRADVTVVEGDATTFDFAPHLGADERAVVVGNLPYNVSAPIYFHLLAERRRFERLVLMFQREVAERLVSGPGTKAYGAPAVATTIFTEARIVRRLPPTAFRPPPRVHSAVVQVDPRPSPLCAIDDEERFLRFVRGVFGFRRKTLANAMAASGILGGRTAVEVAAEAGVDPRVRAETLDATTIWRLYRACGGV